MSKGISDGRASGVSVKNMGSRHLVAFPKSAEPSRGTLSRLCCDRDTAFLYSTWVMVTMAEGATTNTLWGFLGTNRQIRVALIIQYG